MKILPILALLILELSGYSQQLYVDNTELHLKTPKEKVKTFASLGVGTIVGEGVDQIFMICPELYVHIGEGFMISGGFDYTNVNTNSVFLIHLAGRVGYILGNFGVYPGIGPAIGLSSEGHPGITEIMGYISINANYSFSSNFLGGFDLKTLTNFDEGLLLIPTIYLGVRF
jgi:hypothetical protein